MYQWTFVISKRQPKYIFRVLTIMSYNLEERRTSSSSSTFDVAKWCLRFCGRNETLLLPTEIHKLRYPGSIFHQLVHFSLHINPLIVWLTYRRCLAAFSNTRTSTGSMPQVPPRENAGNSTGAITWMVRCPLMRVVNVLLIASEVFMNAWESC